MLTVPAFPARRALAALLLPAAAGLLLAAAALAPREGRAQPPPQAAKDVTVVNPPAEPVPVVEVGEPDRAPFQDQTQVLVAGFLHEPLYTVPAGRRAVIETVSLQLTLPVSAGAGAALGLETTAGGDEALHFLVLESQGVVLTSEVRTANHAVRLHADPGTTVYLDGAAQSGSTIFVTLSGHLVDAP